MPKLIIEIDLDKQELEEEDVNAFLSEATLAQAHAGQLRVIVGSQLEDDSVAYRAVELHFDDYYKVHWEK